MSSELPVAPYKAALFKAMAHPLRVRLLEVLVSGDASVGVLADTLGVELSHLSQQLGVLRAAQIVTARREGKTVFYSLRDPRVSQLLASAKQIVLSALEDSRGLLEEFAGNDESAGLSADSPVR